MASQPPADPVVVGYDGSPPADAALQWAARAADRSHRPLEIVHAAEFLSHRPDDGDGTWRASNLIAEAKEVADRGAAAVAATYPDLRIETAGGLFNAKEVLGERSAHAALMVLGSHGRGRVGTFLLGSTAYAIAGSSRCPVVIVKDGSAEPPGPERPVVVGVNGTPGSDRAVEVAVDVAGQWHAPLILATTWKPAPPDPWDQGPLGYHSAGEASADYRATAETTNAEALQRVTSAHPDLQIEGQVVEGHRVDALVGAAQEAGLLVTGARGHGRLVGTVLGSTSLGVLHEATTPVMIVP